MTVGSIGEAVAAASSLFRFGFRPGPSAQDHPISAIATGDDGDDASEDVSDPEQDALFRAVETALRKAGYLDP